MLFYILHGLRNLLNTYLKIHINSSKFLVLDLSQAYTQLNAWIKNGLVPNPSSEPTIGHGTLKYVDLNLLCNPGGLIAAMKYAKAVSSQVGIDEVRNAIFFKKIIVEI